MFKFWANLPATQDVNKFFSSHVMISSKQTYPQVTDSDKFDSLGHLTCNLTYTVCGKSMTRDNLKKKKKLGGAELKILRESCGTVYLGKANQSPGCVPTFNANFNSFVIRKRVLLTSNCQYALLSPFVDRKGFFRPCQLLLHSLRFADPEVLAASLKSFFTIRWSLYIKPYWKQAKTTILQQPIPRTIVLYHGCHNVTMIHSDMIDNWPSGEETTGGGILRTSLWDDPVVHSDDKVIPSKAAYRNKDLSVKGALEIL